MATKKSPEALRYNKYLNRACREVTGFEALLERFERNISILGRSPRTFDNYSRHVAAMALHFQCLPTELDPEQVKDYLYGLQQRSRTASQTYFKHTVYGLRFPLKTEGLLLHFIICIFLLLTVQKNCPLSLAGRRYGPCYIRRNC